MAEKIDVEDYDQVVKLYEEIKIGIRSELTNYTLFPPTLEENNLISLGFSKVGSKYFHPELKIKTSFQASLFFKLGNLDNLEGAEGVKISDLIYKRDKYAEIRGLSKTSFDVLSTFKSYIENDLRYSKKRIRENGTLKGGLLYKNLRSANNKDANQLYLKAHQHGPKNIGKDLVCHIRNTPLLGRSLTNFEINEEVFILDNQFHHILYEGKKSIHKTNEPSYYFGKMSFVEWPHDVHVEFFGGITLSGDGHDSIHNTNRYDGIDHWFKRLEKGECHSLPYFWNSEANYEEFCVWLECNTTHFKKAKAPTYKEFIESQSTSSLKSLKSKTSLIRNSLSLTKTDPIEQIPSPYKEDYVQQQTPSPVDTQPIYLCEIS